MVLPGGREWTLEITPTQIALADIVIADVVSHHPHDNWVAEEDQTEKAEALCKFIDALMRLDPGQITEPPSG